MDKLIYLLLLVITMPFFAMGYNEHTNISVNKIDSLELNQAYLPLFSGTPAIHRFKRRPKLHHLILASTLIPGAGLARLERNNAYYLISGATYGSLGTSAILMIQSNKTYDSYLNAIESDSRNQLHQKAQNQRRAANGFAIAAAGIWTANFAYLWFRWNKKKKKRKKSSSQITQRTEWYVTGAYNTEMNTPTVILRIKF